jgi:cell division septal protein FtsQ
LVAAVIAIVLIIAYLGFKPKKVVMTGSKHRKKKRKA